MTRLNRSLAGFLGRFGVDRRGESAVEFALHAPVMILLYFSLAEACQAYMAQKRAGHVNAIVGDLIAQYETVDDETITKAFEISSLIMRPFSDTGLAQRVTSVTRDDEGVARVDWSQADGMDELAEDDPVDIPDDLIENGQTLIMTEVEYDYDSPVDYLLPNGIVFDFQSYLRPRRTDFIPYTS